MRGSVKKKAALALACIMLMIPAGCGSKGENPALNGNGDLLGSFLEGVNDNKAKDTTAEDSAEAKSETKSDTESDAQGDLSLMEMIEKAKSTEETEDTEDTDTHTPLTDVEVGDDGIVRLGFAGDLNLSEGWETTEKLDASANGIEDCFDPKLLDMMKDFDIFMLNNEFTYSTRGEKSEKTYTFRANPDRVENLHKIGVDVVLTANNHINDYGPDALVDTLDTLDAAGIPHVGAGRNLDEAKEIVYFNVGDYKLAYVAASCAEEFENTIWTTPATADTPGILGCYDDKDILEVIKKAKETSDYVIVNVHWGYEYLDWYTPQHQELAYRMFDSGADAVIGGHPHVLQGIQMVEGKPIFYSLGNFWFNNEDLYSGMAELDLKIPDAPGGKIELVETKFIPCTQYKVYTALPEDATEKQEIIDHVAGISTDVWLDEDGVVHPY